MADYRRERYYDFDEEQYKRYAKKWLRLQPGFRTYEMAAGLFYLVALLSPFLVPWLLMGEVFFARIDFLLIGIAVGCIAGSLPLCAGKVCLTVGMRKCGGEMIRMQKQFLFTNYSGIQFGYHDSLDENPESMLVFQIAYENIRFVSVRRSEHLICFCGKKEIVVYENLIEDRVRNSLTQGEFGDAADFDFFFCFDREDEFMDNLRRYDVTIEYL